MTMTWLVALIGLLMVILGIAVVFDPARLRRGLYWFLNPRNIYPAALLRIAIGVVFLLASPYTLLPTLIVVLGVVFIGLGVVVPLLGRARLERLEGRWLTLPDPVLRSWGVVMVIVGLLVVWTTV